MAPSNHTHLDIPNQRDNTSLQQDNDSTKLILYCRHNKFIQIEQHLNFLFRIPSCGFGNLIFGLSIVS
jgi:hypothetical protein